MMAATLYDAAFSIVTRARGRTGACTAITAITLAAGFASTLAYPLTADRSRHAERLAGRDMGAGGTCRLSSSCRSTVFAATRLEAEAQARDPASVVATPRSRARWDGPGSGRSGWASR
jgi:hypothetical protein